MRTAVITFPASNCNRDAAMALEKVTGEKPVMVWHRESELPQGIDFVVLPGGFSALRRDGIALSDRKRPRN